jgi:hypothetical protein
MNASVPYSWLLVPKGFWSAAGPPRADLLLRARGAGAAEYDGDAFPAASLADAAAGSLAARGLAFANAHPAPRRWLPLRGPAAGAAWRGAAANAARLRAAAWGRCGTRPPGRSRDRHVPGLVAGRALLRVCRGRAPAAWDKCLGQLEVPAPAEPCAQAPPRARVWPRVKPVPSCRM